MSPDYYLANEDLHFLGQVWIATAGNSCKDQTSLLYRLYTSLEKRRRHTL